MSILLWVVFGAFMMDVIGRILSLARGKYPRQTSASYDAICAHWNLALAFVVLFAILVWL